jgi:hypothetical protein
MPIEIEQRQNISPPEHIFSSAGLRRSNYNTTVTGQILIETPPESNLIWARNVPDSSGHNYPI